MSVLTQVSHNSNCIKYNDLQFGEYSFGLHSTMPTYKLNGQFVYDDSGRSIKGTKYTLSVHSIFTADDESLMATAITLVRQKLSEPRKELVVTGLGTGLETLNSLAAGVASRIDRDWGPKPISVEFSPVGNVAFEVLWNVEFTVVDCSADYDVTTAFYAFNFDCSWDNDYEGLVTRTISGYGEVATTANTRKVPLFTADRLRDKITVICPVGFRRVHNVWRESPNKLRLDFVVVDQTMPGTPPPPGFIAADGELTVASIGPAFNQNIVTMNMRLRTSPSYPPALAKNVFMAAMSTKQKNLNGGTSKGAAIPLNFYLSSRKFDGARETTGSVSWRISKPLSEVLTKAGLWEPIVNTNYTQWRTSIENLYHNRGVATFDGQQIRSDPSEGVVISICDNVSSVIIGRTPAYKQSEQDKVTFQFTCPEVPADGGWLTFETRLTILEDSPQTWHQKAVSFLPGIASAVSRITQGTKTGTGGPSYDQSAKEQHDVEYNGYPYTHVMLQYRAVRLRHKPVPPRIVSIDGKPATEVERRIEPAELAFDSICNVWKGRGYIIYRVNGPIRSVEQVESEISSASNGYKENY